MGLSINKKERTQQIIVNTVRKELDENQYLRKDVKYTHFCYPLLGKEIMSIFFFVQSLGTSFLSSIYEEIAVVLANDRFKHIATQVKPHNQISTDAQHQINMLMDGLLSVTIDMDPSHDIERLRKVCQTGGFHQIDLPKVDVWLESFDGSLHLINMEILNPNKDNSEKIEN